MEVLAAFLLLLVAIAVVIIGGALWLLASSLRRRKLASGEDKIDRHMIGAETDGQGGREGASPTTGRRSGRERGRGRPEHHRVANEQGSRSIPHA